jgi:O-antigen biosynthesis protein
MTDRPDPDRDRGPADPGADDEPAALRRRMAHLEEELQAANATIRRLTTLSQETASELADARRQLGFIQRNPVLRRGVELARRGRRAVRAARRRIVDVPALPMRLAGAVVRRLRRWRQEEALRATPEAEQRLATAIRDLDPGSPVTGGPLVSIVMLNRDGLRHLRRIMPALETTLYRDIELIVVDNASTDGSIAFLEGFRPRFPLRIVRNRRNRSFSDANNQGLAEARGELILLLNNDVEPVTGHWLGHLVETLQSRSAVAVGARLVFPRSHGGPRGGTRFGDLTLQHRGVAFEREEGIAFPRPLGGGENPLSPPATGVEEVPALTAACFLIRRRDLDAVGGFASGYDYGIEDMDLCVRLRERGGRLIYDGRSALWHHESATRARAARERAQRRVASNRRTFIDRWAPRLTREVLLDALEGSKRWTGRPFHVGIGITRDDPDAGYGDWHTGHELGDALAALGWQVTYLERFKERWLAPDPSIDVIISLLDAYDIRALSRQFITVAWTRNWGDRWVSRPWFDDYDLVFASSDSLCEVVRSSSSKVARKLPIASNPVRFRPVEPDPARACDVLFVGNYWGKERGVVQALPALAADGLSVHVYGKGWDEVPGFADLHRGYLSYDDIPAAYASARVVVDDTATPTKPYGSVNSRVFDALAAGAVVVSDNEIGVRELFGDDLPTWSDARSLREVVRTVIDDPAAARLRAERAHRRVLAAHTYAHRAADLREALAGWVSARRFGIRIGPPSWEVAGQWGDLHFARAIQRQLERAGHPTRVHVLPDWDAEVAATDDVTLHLFGLRVPRNRPAQVNLLWQISHPDLATPELYGSYDVAFVASDRFARRMASQTDRPVIALHQATDPERFTVAPTGPTHEILFVGNTRGVRRKAIDDLLPTSHDVAVYGKGWSDELVDPSLVRGESIPNRDLNRYYGSAAIVLNDHWPDMRAEGFISNRIYDVLAAGGFVITDDVEGIEAEFDGAVPTYDGPEELRELVDRCLADPEERRRRVERGRRAVLERHTFAHRVQTILQTAGPLLAARPPRIEGVPAVADGPLEMEG